MVGQIKKRKIAIICPVVNCLNYTKQFLSSIPKSDDYGIIIINNASTDGTEVFLNSLNLGDQLIVVNSQENLGVAKSWNLGINIAIEKFDSDYFFIPNNDIVIRPETISILASDLSQKDVLLASAYNINDGKNVVSNLINLPLIENSVYIEHPDFSCFMIKKETIEKIGYFDENIWPAYFEDNDYHYRINLAGFKAVKNLKNIYFHFGSQTVKNDQNTAIVSNSNYLKNKEYFKQKWGGYPGEETYKTPFGK
jgi:GT2 family glycosyltransferase